MVHWVDEGLDTGNIIAQKDVSFLKSNIWGHYNFSFLYFLYILLNPEYGDIILNNPLLLQFFIFQKTKNPSFSKLYSKIIKSQIKNKITPIFLLN